MRFRLNEQKVFSDVTDGIGILIDTETGVYFGLNELTTNVYENIISGNDTDDILSQLSKVKGYSDEISDKFMSFVKDLQAKDFIIETETATASLLISIEEYSDEELDFVLSEYPDVTELLLADPIHEVNEYYGWMPQKDVLK